MSGDVTKVGDDQEVTQAFINNGTKSPKNVNNDLGKKDAMLPSLEEFEELREQLYMLRKYLKALAIVVFFGIIILLVVVTILYTNLDRGLKTHKHPVAPKVGENITRLLERQEVCFKCSEIRLGPSVEEANMLNAFRRRPNKAGEECCLDTPSQLLKLLKLFVEKRFLEEKSRGKINIHRDYVESKTSITTSAHLMGPRHRLIEGVGRQFALSNWTDDVGLAFRTRDMVYRYGRLVVPTDGMYYVYSQVSFLERFDDDRARRRSRSKTLSHYLYRYNMIYPRGGEEMLTQNSITKCCTESKSFGEYSSYLGAVFQLRGNDEIYVKVSNLSILSKDPKLNYFGLFRV